MAVWKYTLAGIDLDDYQAQIIDVDGLEGMPSRRGRNVTVPFRHGSYTATRKWYEPRLGALNVRVYDTDTAGDFTDGNGRWGHAEDNLDRFKALLYSNATIGLVKTMADGSSTRTLDVEFMSDVQVRQLDESRGVFDVRALFEAPDPFWYEAAGTTQLGTVTAAATANVVVGGNAPVGDAVFTFVADTAIGLSMTLNTADGTPTLTFSGTANGTVVVDCGARTIRDGAGVALAEVAEWDRSYWGEFTETSGTADVVFAITSGTAIVSVVHEDKWF